MNKCQAFDVAKSPVISLSWNQKRHMKLEKYEHLIRLVFVGVILSLTYLLILIPAGFLEGARIRSYDTTCRWRNALFSPPPELQQMVLVTIDEESQRQLDQKWPWNRDLLADFLRAVSPHRPQMVLFDLVLAGAGEPAHDRALAEALRESPPALLACYLDRRGDPVFPLPLFTEAGGIMGLINKPRDVDLTVRSLFAGIRIPLHREPIYALEVQAAALAKGIPPEDLRLDLRNLTLGSTEVPLEIPGVMAINYRVDLRRIPQISFWRILQDPRAAPQVRDKIVLVGSASEMTHDVYPTPLGLMPGVLISANGIVTLLSGQFLRPFPLILALLLGVLLVTLILLLTYGLPLAAGLAATVGLTISSIFAGFLGLVWLNYRTEYLSILILAGIGWLSGVFYKYFLLRLEERSRALEKALADLQKAHKAMEGNFLEVTKALVMALETKDETIVGHLERVSGYSTRLAEVLSLPPEEVETIREAALLHDIGKIGLPDEVLHKVGPLTEEEKNILKQHLGMGARILEPMKFFRPITTLITHHHERYDGKGYPHGLTGEFIPTGAQIIAIADAFDAMTTHRGYNTPRTMQGALNELRKGSGTQFNPTYVGAFIQLIEKDRLLSGHQG